MAKLICPYCGSPTSFSPAEVVGKGVISEYSSDKRTTWGDVRISAVVPYKPDISEEAYAILVCQACMKNFVAKSGKLANKDAWSAVYPIQHKTVATEIPPPIRGEFEEANLCFAVGAYKACISMCMTALETLWRDKGASGLDDLRDKGFISSGLFDQATEIRLWAGMVKHELIHEIVKSEEAEELLTYLKDILDNVYVQPSRIAALQQKRKQLKKDNKSEDLPF